jgi:cation:H+ antiporter
VINPVAIDPAIVRFDMWVMLAATLALFPPLLFGARIPRFYGLLMLAGYVAYVWYLLRAVPA